MAHLSGDGGGGAVGDALRPGALLPSACKTLTVGKPGAILSRQTTLEMLTKLKNDYGLGVGLEGEGRTLRFAHGGRDEGFDAMLMAYAETGQGAIIMINANDNSRDGVADSEPHRQ
ncbi:MAG: hypothetical protein WKF84_03950 [Pyrinomonadaceae bacterium]